MQALHYAVSSLLVCAASAARTHCERDFSGTSFEYIPDAWQLIDKHGLKFHLMFTSKNALSAPNYKCLTTLRTETVRHNRWERKIFYCTFPNRTTTLTTWSLVGSRKAGGCYVYDNLITASDNKGKKKPDWRSRILYTDYRTCILLRSQRLGYQVWATKDYVDKHGEIPYICVLLYEVYAGLAKHWVYDWDVCSSWTNKIA
ncbi:uncharacterized protein LOC144123414 [Amblyomma americanum]